MNLHEGEWCCVEQEGGAEAAEVEEMLQRMHGEASEGLDVRVPVVDAVDVLVHGLGLVAFGYVFNPSAESVA